MKNQVANPPGAYAKPLSKRADKACSKFELSLFILYLESLLSKTPLCENPFPKGEMITNKQKTCHPPARFSSS